MKLITTACVLAFLNFFTGNVSAEKCAIEYKKVGCFKDRIVPEGSLSTESISDSEPENRIWDLNTLEWKEWSDSLEILACLCAEKAKLFGYKFFGLYFFGKCWSGSLLTHNNRGERSTNCISEDFKRCNDSSSETCVGKTNTNYIYSFVKDEKYSANGYWSEWSQWTECSATCDGGVRSRSRTCNTPKKVGAYCDGKEEENEPCNEEVCTSKCTKQIEIGILLDASTSVTLSNWKKTIDFVQDFSKQFKMGPTGVRFALIDFSDDAILQISISDPRFWDQETFGEKVSSIEYSQGKTRTDLALEVARKHVFCNECGLRHNTPRLLIVLTDGQSTFPKLTQFEAQLIKAENNLTIISVGVSDQVDIEELKSLATDRDHVFLLNGYSYLNDKINKLLKVSCISKQKSPINGGWGNWSEWTECSASCNGGIRIRERLCNNPLPQNGGIECIGEGEEERACNEEICEPACTSEMEIAILLDASSSVTLNNWEKTLEFVQDFSKEFKMGSTGIRFAVIDFSDAATLQIDILDPSLWSNEAFNEKISNIEYSMGKTRTDLALKLAREKVFCRECGLRVNVPKLVIVVTDGRSTFPFLTLPEARLIKNQASVICMGVGDEVDINELNTMATDKNHVFLLNGYRYINDKVNQILKMSCKRKS
ncbi:collagen alpha-1(XII) chain [Hydra vulgaris]|uniref:collagen alpha-1(XII) chain n=1 Tax=Hydra vulgaris TaxID=6087 RepID=UPI001F5EA4D5|nr:collagen alpha-1(XII) chain-like [Hydra vulgaris]